MRALPPSHESLAARRVRYAFGCRAALSDEVYSHVAAPAAAPAVCLTCACAHVHVCARRPTAYDAWCKADWHKNATATGTATPFCEYLC